MPKAISSRAMRSTERQRMEGSSTIPYGMGVPEQPCDRQVTKARGSTLAQE